MCGICGYLSKKRIDEENLSKMNDLMIHRGPDDSGVFVESINSESYIGLAQRRLSIIDLSSLGHQPMFSNSKEVIVAFNGEIYNYKELKKELDYPFKSNCDTEVIIAAYLKWGIEFVDHFNGMFAISLYDKRNDRLILARDYVGKKPLYYYYNGSDLIWASELKPILNCPIIECNIRNDIIGRYITNKYINAPDTILENVYKLEPGSMLCLNGISKNLTSNIEIHKYWDVNERYHFFNRSRIDDYAEAKEELESLLIDAVTTRMNADVPMGVIFSGGYDSSLVAAIAQGNSKEPIKTFTIGFQEKEYDESKYAREIAEYLGTNHTELIISEKELFEQLDNIEYFFDEPFADSSQIPTMLVSKLARTEVKVALGGDGGDEFFCGYPMYETAKKVQKLDGLGQITHSVCNSFLLKKFNIESRLPVYVQTITKARDDNTKTQFRTVFGEKAGQLLTHNQLNCLHPIEEKYDEKDLMKRRMLVDMDTFLPGDILCKSDRSSMRYSLELRSPLLDKNVIEYSYRLNHNMKYEKGNKKRILKDISYKYIPKNLLERPKQGFNVPLSKWLCGALNEELHDYINEEFIKRQDIFGYEKLKSFIEVFENDYKANRHKGTYVELINAEMIWSFFLFQRWYVNIYEKRHGKLYE